VTTTLAHALDAEHWLPGARLVPTSNCDQRPAGELVSLVVIHAISLPPGVFGGDAIERLFTNRLDPGEHPYYADIHTLRVSAHFLIERDGNVLQFVPCHMRAWHAGISRWRDRLACNNFSIGIELEGCDEQPFETAQYAALRHILAVLKRHYPITDIVGHQDVSPGRKTDPGPCFDWQRLA
jgi:AmpD protein